MKHSQNIKVNEHDIKYLVVVQSHPMRVRGLKLSIKPVVDTAPGSHPMWVRALQKQGYIYTTPGGISRTKLGCVG